MTTNQAREIRSRTRVVQPGAPDLALANYLDSMLHEATSQITQVEELLVTIEPDPEKPVADASAKLKSNSLNEIKTRLKEKLKSEIDQKDEVITKTAAPTAEPEVDAEQQQARLVEEQIAEEVLVAEQERAELGKSWQPGSIPAWGEGDFDCLMFTVNGLTLGIPMLLLGTLYPLDQEITPLFEQPDWFLGLMRTTDEKNIRVVDTADLVMPDKAGSNKTERSYKFGIGIFGTDWALGAASIEGSKVIASSQVKWRTTRTSRGWLAGTIKEEMCAIIDPKAFVELLLEKKKKRLKAK